MLKGLTFFLLNWLGWWCWINTVGRISGGLSIPSVAAFDVLSVICLGSFFGAFRPSKWRFDIATPAHAFKRFLSASTPSRGKFPFWALPAIVSIGSALFYCMFTLAIDWDGLDYHLPAILQAIQHRQWGTTYDTYYAVQAYPMLVESLYLYWIAHFGHKFYLALGLIPIGIGAIALDALACHFKVSRKWVFLLWCTIPILIKQASSLYIDAFVAVFGVMACVGLVQGRAFLFSLALAFFVGAKFSAFMPAFILLLSWVLRYRSLPMWVIPFCGITLGGTLIPNFNHFGNPFFPFEVGFLGHTVFPGLFRPDNFVSGMPWVGDPVWVRLFRAFLGMEPVAYWDMLQAPFGWVQGVLIACALAMVIYRLVKHRSSVQHFPILPEGLVALSLSKGFWMLRYHLWVLSTFLLWSADFIHKLPRKLKALIWVGLVLQASWLWLDRVWFIGLAPQFKSVVMNRDFVGISSLMTRRFSELVQYGEPQEATHPVDQARIAARKIRRKVYTFCPEKRPQQLGAYYGYDFSNQVYFNRSACLD